MRHPTSIPYAAASLLALAGAAAPASERFVQPIGIEYAAERLAAACAAPGSPACSEELGSAATEAARRLVELARYRPELAEPLALRAAESSFPELRAAAAEALAQPFATASVTPLLRELLDDPVAAVRAAARRALAGSSDESIQPLVHRAESDARSGDGAFTPDAAPAASQLGIALPGDAAYLYLASDAAGGRATYLTAEAPAKLVATLAKKGRGPFTPEQFRQEIERQEASSEAEMEKLDSGDEMPSAEQMAQIMAMAQKVMAAMEANPNASPGQQAAALAKAAGRSLLDAGLAEAYTDSEIYGDPKLFIVELAGGGEAAVAVYLDRALGRTGVTIHRPQGFGG